MSGSVSLVIRTVHVLAMGVIVGGAATVWYRYRSRSSADLCLARRYEWAFWGALGVLVLTGVGNLGAVGVPDPATERGQILLAKVLLVLGVVCGSAVRTLVVSRAAERATESDGSASIRRMLGRTYGVTTAGLVAIVVLAEVLAHG